MGWKETLYASVEGSIVQVTMPSGSVPLQCWTLYVSMLASNGRRC